MEKLYFGSGNAKLDKFTAICNLPAGVTCPGAGQCRAFTKKDNTLAKVRGSNEKYRCYAVQAEMYPKIRERRYRNLNLLKGKSKKELVQVILNGLPDAKVRIHESGDFFSQDYLDAWVEVAKKKPRQQFYGYTKSVHFLLQSKESFPNNFRIVASKGGKFDALIEKYKIQYAEVVHSIQEAKEKGLDIDHDDSHCFQDEPFAVLIHGTQNAGSPAMRAMMDMRKMGINGYSRKKKGDNHGDLRA